MPHTSGLLTQQEMLGTVELVTHTDPEKFMSSSPLGLDNTSESWSVASHGKWCSQEVERERD